MRIKPRGREIEIGHPTRDTITAKIFIQGHSS